MYLICVVPVVTISFRTFLAALEGRVNSSPSDYGANALANTSNFLLAKPPKDAVQRIGMEDQCRSLRKSPLRPVLSVLW